MPRRRQLDLSLVGIALARTWLVGDPVTVERLEGELVRVLERPDAPWFDAPEAGVDTGYAAWASTYDDSTPGNWIIQIDNAVVNPLLADAPPGVALDAACGTGRHAKMLASLGHEVIGIDASQPMLDQAQRSLPDVDLRLGDLASLPLEDHSVDLAVCSLALTHVIDIAPAISELARVVRAGGRIILSDVHPCYVTLGAQAAYKDADDHRAFVRNHVHWHSSYLDAFIAAGISCFHCIDQPLNPPQIDLVAATVDLPRDVVSGALEALPAILAWDVRSA
jgi:ubiquinone/menaquinone biosynthesis C-methylase UbiE